MAFFVTAVHPAFSHFWAPARFTSQSTGEAGIREKGLATFHGHCREIDAMLADREWFLGRFSAADCYGFVFCCWGLRASLPMRDLGGFTVHKDRTLQRPAVGYASVLCSPASSLTR